MSTLVDTNLLARIAQPTHVLHHIALDALAVLGGQGEPVVIVPQIIYELWVVGTRPLAQNGLGMSAQEAQAEVLRAKQLFAMIGDVPAIFRTWERLVTQHQIIGKAAHDARLAAAMIVHRIDRILTFNVQDFTRYP